MNLQLVYKIIAKIYDLLDVVYFSDYNRSPRKVVYEAVKEKDKVLDICTGTAENAIHIAKNKPNTKVAGIDISKDMLKIAKNKVKRKGIANIKIGYMDAVKLQFRNETFDKVMISLVLHEVEESMAKQMILEAKRVLKKDGRIIITEWEPAKSGWRKIVFLPVHLLEPKTYREFIKKDMKKYFSEFGLNIVKTIHCDYSKVMIVERSNF